MIPSDLLKQGILGELGVRAKMLRIGRVAVCFWGPSAIGVTPIASNTTENDQTGQSATHGAPIRSDKRSPMRRTICREDTGVRPFVPNTADGMIASGLGSGSAQIEALVNGVAAGALPMQRCCTASRAGPTEANRMQE